MVPWADGIFDLLEFHGDAGECYGVREITDDKYVADAEPSIWLPVGRDLGRFAGARQ